MSLNPHTCMIAQIGCNGSKHLIVPLLRVLLLPSSGVHRKASLERSRDVSYAHHLHASCLALPSVQTGWAADSNRMGCRFKQDGLQVQTGWAADSNRICCRFKQDGLQIRQQEPSL
jgi:hypothetical protein